MSGRDVHPPPHREGRRVEPASQKGAFQKAGREGLDAFALAAPDVQSHPARAAAANPRMTKDYPLRQGLLRPYDRRLWLERETAATGGPLTPGGQATGQRR